MRGIAGREEGWGWSDPCGEEEDDLLQGLEPERLDSGRSCQQWGGGEEGDVDPAGAPAAPIGSRAQCRQVCQVSEKNRKSKCFCEVCQHSNIGTYSKTLKTLQATRSRQSRSDPAQLCRPDGLRPQRAPCIRTCSAQRADHHPLQPRAAISGQIPSRRETEAQSGQAPAGATQQVSGDWGSVV